MRISLILIFVVIICSCNEEHCVIVEKHSDNTPKLKVCNIDKKSNLLFHTKLTSKGILESSYYTLDEQLHGEKIMHYSSGKMKSKCNYKKGVKEGLCLNFFEEGEIKARCNYLNGYREGDCFFYNKDGKINTYNFCSNDKTLHGKFFNYDNEDEIMTEAFAPKINFIKDSFSSSDNRVIFKVSLPIADSILENRNLSFLYDFKPISFADSLLTTPNFSISLKNSKEKLVELRVKYSKTQLVYGYIFNEDNNSIFEYFEQKIHFEDVQM